MQIIKREILLGIAVCSLVFTGVLAWGHPFVGIGNGATAVQAQEPQQQQPQQKDPAKSTIFTGTIARDGEQFVLRDSSGGIFKLDNAEQAQSFVGKAVKVTGRLDEEAKLIHVDSIEVVSA